MKTGVILELDGGRAVVLDGSGAFRSVPARPEWRTGDVVPLSGQRRHWAVPAAACLVLVLAGSGGWLVWRAPAALVSLDVNPSVELTLNRFDRVVSTRAMNDEGAELLEQGGVEGMTAGRAVAALLDSDFLEPYLARENYVALTVQAEDSGLEAELLTLVDATAAASVAPGTSVSCHSVDQDLVREAHGHGVTAGKYLALLELQAADPDIDITDYAHCGLGEIQAQAQRCHAAANGQEDGQPIADGGGDCGMGDGHGHGHGHG